MKHAEEFQRLRQLWAPDHGQVLTLQGELIRSIVRLRDEAEQNGNADWDEGYELFCDFIEITFKPLRMANPHARERIETILNRLRQPRIAYLDYALFDELADYAVVWCRKLPQPVPREYDPRQYR